MKILIQGYGYVTVLQAKWIASFHQNPTIAEAARASLKKRLGNRRNRRNPNAKNRIHFSLDNRRGFDAVRRLG